MADKRPYIHHSLLGYVPNPGFRGLGSANSRVTIDSDGLRFTGEPPISSNCTMLVVGGSYAYGEGTSDTETWPAQLQRLIGCRVLNGGVSGYGFDQIVLRTEQLVARHKPYLVVVDFTADNIRRTEFRRFFWRDKPWFGTKDGKLVLKGVPVPTPRRLPFRLRHRLEQILIQLSPPLQQLLRYHLRAHPKDFGEAIALRLTERLARLLDRRTTVIMMAQYQPQIWVNREIADEERRLTKAILDCAAANGLITLDTFPRLAAESAPSKFYASHHMNARGNLMIASLVKAALPALLAKRTT